MVKKSNRAAVELVMLHWMLISNVTLMIQELHSQEWLPRMLISNVTLMSLLRHLVT